MARNMSSAASCICRIALLQAQMRVKSVKPPRHKLTTDMPELLMCLEFDCYLVSLLKKREYTDMQLQWFFATLSELISATRINLCTELPVTSKE